MTATLLNGDCLELMKSLPDRSIDLFLCDLPYGCLSAKRGGVRVGECPADNPNGNIVVVNKPCEWDVKIDLEQFWIQVERLMKDEHTPIIHFCSTRFGVDLINSKPAWFRYDLVWNKMRGISFLSANKMPMRSHELMYVFSKKGARYTRVDVEGDFPKSMATNPRKNFFTGDTMPNKLKDNTGKRCVVSIVNADGYVTRKKGQHPTQKPDELYSWLIERYSKEGDTILDPTAGSFASVFTATAMGRNAIGMEMKKEFYDKALARSVPEIIIPQYNNADLPSLLNG